ncbi:enoyl-CoA hydratase/isomerase family protein [Rhizobium bangladeshense]|uniref:Enoyl-CoA hydratase/isomerase family protein n=1 Tax=Rhizobium bangladeshense TaxID=1138189 RepID=A0ABS7LIC8_9HYPH|nr:enoyl-CoA hydratase/isomerase family protein [Rhizobium bangladeshense]MBX4871655.1 enoyl-CoA hydratase/isomerase family protein [Rhizobium bangladeshense]MBX4882969.1 enoyl-CoA hydratase/isomerase family protein [Rhizobium bangladeshense]MBX4896862.1 enoyl-CoA hydratase/isomerase family protein [Rhizobium bangladeshense]MBX4901096.1 enoyl-CoA hydratase/isomerase family protein [Rhizobium bangladeshense]MBX4915806.1 enoyl-CoA hydratase/isomerase family protein [Rhizobium bangladeshense]
MNVKMQKSTTFATLSSQFLAAAALLMLPAPASAGQTLVAEKSDRASDVTAQSAKERPQIRIDKRSPAYWRVTFDNPPFNIFGPETIPQMEKVVAEIETDPKLKIVVFDSAVPGFFLTHYNFTPPLAESTSLPSGRTGLHPLPDMLVRISKAPVVSIALIRGRATGVGSELALASDMRFASREKAILSQWEVGAGFVPGGGPMARLPRLMGRGRALEVLLGSDDINGELAEKYGYVNRSFDDDKLDPFVDALAARISGFDRQAIADTKRLVDFASLPSDPEIGAGWDAFISSVQRPVAQKNIGRLMGMGLQTNPDIEARLGHYTQTLGND